MVEGSVDSDRLNGWKEIAGFLGKGVRTVQRWERELGLPVHRLGREGGEIVFAFKREINDWSLGRDAARRGEGREAGRDARRPGDASVDGRGATGDGSRRRRVVTPAAALALIVGATGAFLVLGGGRLGPPRQPGSWRVNGDTLSVLDEAGDLLWTHRFPARLAETPYLSQGKFPHGNPAAIVDLDGDGEREIVLGVIPVDMRGPLQGIFVFNHDGSPRFDFRPTSTVRFGSTEYRGPWLFHRLAVTQQPDGQPTLWAVFVHGMEFPSVLVELDPAGQVRSEYWSNGFIADVIETTWLGRPTVMVGATNNESRGASVAVFDRNRVTGSAPAVDPHYRCADCPAGQPDEFLVFPRRCLMRSVDGQPTVSEIWHDSADRLHVAVTSLSPFSPRAAGAVFYWLRPDLTPEQAEVTAEFRTLHRLMEQGGYLDHPFDPADEGDLFPVRRWNESTFVDLPAAPVTR